MVRCDKEGYIQRAGYACMILTELIFVDLKANCFKFRFVFFFWLGYFFRSLSILFQSLAPWILIDKPLTLYEAHGQIIKNPLF